MKRKSILALNLTTILLVSISLFGCGNTSRTRANNDVTRQNDITNDGIRSGSVDGTGTGANNAQNGTDGNMQGGTYGIGNSSDGIGGTGNGTAGGNANQNNAGGDTNQNNVAGSNSDVTRDRTGLTTDSTRYGASDFKNDFTNAGYNVTESANTKNDYFKGNETDYLLGGDVVRVYEYNSPTELEWDINRITPNGMTVNGNNANHDARPHYYKKGNTLIVYEGKEPAYVDEFGKMYGNTIRP
ncbi:hypothetical protein [Clostridium beijerinckii]|uniref:hypothetical protein n=1 Tax=Clostridium beijerinckii TaxID=1520 RepID=UPI00047AE306|nr:hypothetical protein [Clostridium beijerinckii]